MALTTEEKDAIVSDAGVDDRILVVVASEARADELHTEFAAALPGARQTTTDADAHTCSFKGSGCIVIRVGDAGETGRFDRVETD